MNAIHPMQTGNTFKPNKKTGKKKHNPLKDQRVVDYLDAKYLSRFTNDQGKILPRRITGVTAYQQRLVARAVKYARHLALMPFVAQDIN
ncbi:MAG: 30S ribosomal protein S18 [Candidatus Kapaibacterium sp.]|jgi:small subunit ribosomal protein S18|nr:30S ribosomal protein S18 [Candidatus Kapabacteria bacterium]